MAWVRRRRFGDYSQWDAWQRAQQAKAARSVPAEAPRSAAPPDDAPAVAAKKKLSYLEAREFAAMENENRRGRKQLGALRAALEDPAIASDASRLHDTYTQMEAAQSLVDKLYARWSELEQKLR